MTISRKKRSSYVPYPRWIPFILGHVGTGYNGHIDNSIVLSTMPLNLFNASLTPRDPPISIFMDYQILHPYEADILPYNPLVIQATFNASDESVYVEVLKEEYDDSDDEEETVSNTEDSESPLITMMKPTLQCPDVFTSIDVHSPLPVNTHKRFQSSSSSSQRIEPIKLTSLIQNVGFETNESSPSLISYKTHFDHKSQTPVHAEGELQCQEPYLYNITS